MGNNKDTKGLTAEKDDFSGWFTQIMLKAELADYSSVSGMMVFRPSAYAIWEKIVAETDKRFKNIGIKNAYFPLFIPEKSFAKEKEHVEGFTPEVAWVTQSGESKLNEKLAVRPTSEAIMYESYSKWVRSWRDLPLRINQWNNVVRWEFKHPVPFLRTREFLWNEGHTAFATEKESLNEEKEIMNVYKDVCENYLALYGVLARKTDKEKFAGAVFSEKIHYLMPNGKSIEGPAFHHDGQNFSKAYCIKFLNSEGKEDYVWQNTFAISTRMLGVLFAVHSDEKGLVLPPKIAPNKIVIVPIFKEENKDKVLKAAENLKKELTKFEVILDDREEHRPGYKFNEWELKGVPIRLEIGERDIKKEEVVLVRRDNGKKSSVKIGDVKKEVEMVLEKIQRDMFDRSKRMYEDRLKEAKNFEELKKMIDEGYMVKVPLSNDFEAEDMLKYKTGGAKTIYVTDDKVEKGTECIVNGGDADYYVYVGKSY